MTEDDVRAWLDGYVEAWRTYDRDRIVGLFTLEATYRYHPWDEPLRGAEAIASNWLEDPDPPGSWRTDYAPTLVADDGAVVTGTTRYANGSEYWNVFVLRFAADGRCADFTEWFMKRPD